jgi:hypothetical protein
MMVLGRNVEENDLTSWLTWDNTSELNDDEKRERNLACEKARDLLYDLDCARGKGYFAEKVRRGAKPENDYIVWPKNDDRDGVVEFVIAPGYLFIDEYQQQPSYLQWPIVFTRRSAR